MLLYIYIYISIYIYIYIYTVPKYKYLTLYISGSTERNCTKLGQCGEGMNTKYCFHLGSNWVSGTFFFQNVKKHTFLQSSVLAATFGFWCFVRNLLSFFQCFGLPCGLARPLIYICIYIYILYYRLQIIYLLRYACTF